MKYLIFLAAFMSTVALAASQTPGCTPDGFCPKTPEDFKKLKAAQEARQNAKQSSNQALPTTPATPNKPAVPPSNLKPEPATKPK